jgi:hypothetical protein
MAKSICLALFLSFLFTEWAAAQQPIALVPMTPFGGFYGAGHIIDQKRGSDDWLANNVVILRTTGVCPAIDCPRNGKSTLTLYDMPRASA